MTRIENSPGSLGKILKANWAQGDDSHRVFSWQPRQDTESHWAQGDDSHREFTWQPRQDHENAAGHDPAMGIDLYA